MRPPGLRPVRERAARQADRELVRLPEVRRLEEHQLQVQRLKKRKLYLRDRIAHIEDQLTPDIIA